MHASGRIRHRSDSLDAASEEIALRVRLDGPHDIFDGVASREWRLLVGYPKPCAFIVKVCGGTKRFENRHVGFLCRDTVGENGDVTRLHCPAFGHADRTPARVLRQMVPDVVALQDTGRIWEDHDRVGRCRRARIVRAAGPEVLLHVPEISLCLRAISYRPYVQHGRDFSRSVRKKPLARPRATGEQYLHQDKDERGVVQIAPLDHKRPLATVEAACFRISSVAFQEAAGSVRAQPFGDRF